MKRIILFLLLGYWCTSNPMDTVKPMPKGQSEFDAFEFYTDEDPEPVLMEPSVASKGLGSLDDLLAEEPPPTQEIAIQGQEDKCTSPDDQEIVSDDSNEQSKPESKLETEDSHDEDLVLDSSSDQRTQSDTDNSDNSSDESEYQHSETNSSDAQNSQSESEAPDIQVDSSSDSVKTLDPQEPEFSKSGADALLDIPRKRLQGPCIKLSPQLKMAKIAVALAPAIQKKGTAKLKRCPICGYETSRLANLTRHMVIHTGEKPFKCHYCDKAFADDSGRHAHERSLHSGKKPHACPYEECLLAFTTAADLKKHIYTHTDENPYECKICKKKFKQISNLRKHERTVHDGKKLFKCTNCNKSFTNKRNRDNHLKKCTKK